MNMTIYSKVKAAGIAALLVGAIAAVDQFSSLDLSFLGAWAIPAGAALATLVAFAKKELAGFAATQADASTVVIPGPVQIPPAGFEPDAGTVAALEGHPTHPGEAVAP